MKRFIAAGLGLLLVAGCARSGAPGKYSRTETLMDTFVQVKAVAPGYSREKIEEAVNGAFELARQLEKKFSVYDPGSEVNALNKAKSLTVSPELFDLLRMANGVSLITEGEFDVTVAPVMKANGFYGDMPAELLKDIPDDFSGVNWKNVKIRMDKHKILLVNNAWIDLSGIAKGYIVDRMSDHLRGNGIESSMVNAGGDIYCGRKGKDGDWRIGVRKPGAKNIVMTLDIGGMAVATSGDYENVAVDKETGEIVSHIVDPRTDTPVKERASSVTVIAPSCARADALATGMMAMGREKALALADTLEDVEIIVIECTPEGHSTYYSRNAVKYLSK